MTVLGGYWVRGAIYVLATLLVFYTLRPAFDYVSALEDRIGFILAIALLGVFVPTIAGWIGARFFSPLVSSWKSIKSMQSWEDRIVDELTPGKSRAFPVVIVSWPTLEVRTLALLASRYKSACGTTELACVYIPGAPDPLRGGALRVVSIDSIEMTAWSMSDLFTNCISFGATAPQLFSDATRRNWSSPEQPPE